MVKKQRYAVFYGEFENEKKKGQKNLTFLDGDLIFQQIPAQNLKFEGD